MEKLNTSTHEKQIHEAFEIGIFLKGIHAVIEIAGGVFAFFVTKSYITTLALTLTQGELKENPSDVLANYILSTSNNFSTGTQHFVSFYLLTHGMIKLFLIINLFRKKMWAYPVSIAIFSMFIIYQLYRYSFTHSVWLLLFTFFDTVIIWLTFHEYKKRKNT